MSSNTPLIMKRASEFTKTNQCMIPLSDSLSLHVYSDTKPHNAFISDLQKGLILVYKEVEMVGEGTGLGVPVLVYSDETYFSGLSHVYSWKKDDCKIICKEFFMDEVQRTRISKVKLENQKLAHTFARILRYVTEAYQKHRHLRFLTAEKLYWSMGIKTSFVKTTPSGKVIATYCLSEGHIDVRMDFSLLKRRNLQKIFVLNELGSTFFRMYLDSDGTKLVDKQIGAWETVEAEWASITDIRGGIGFRLWRAKNSVLRRGREFLKGHRDWIGLDYEINPNNNIFEYEIEILGAKPPF